MNVLVIKLGAFGDLVQSCWAFHALRRHHASDRITLLTAERFTGFARQMPFFDEVLGDSRPRLWRLRAWLRLRDTLNTGAFDLVYDLQRRPRTRWYYRLFRRKPVWVGVPPTMDDLKGHNVERYMGMIAQGGVAAASAPPWDWLAGDISGLKLPSRFALLIPGSSPHLPHKRWPAENYAALAAWLRAERGLESVLIGTRGDAEMARQIQERAPAVINLIEQTDFAQVTTIARQAATVVGNDTGPTFLAAAVGAPTLMLMSYHTDPARASPYGPKAAWLKRQDLATLTVAEVEPALLWR